MKLRSILMALSLLSVNMVFSQNHSLNFDGIDDYVNINAVASPMANSTSFTIEFWMKADSNNQSSSSYPSTSLVAINLATATSTGSNRLLIMLGNPYGTQNGKLWIGNNIATPFQSSTNIGDNNCHHIAYSHSGNIGSIYIDGILEGSFTDSINLSTSDLYSIGQEWDGTTTSQFYNGEIDKLRFWNTARSQAEIQANIYSQLNGNEPGLIANYSFDQGIPSGNNSGINTLNDNTANGLTGTLNNFALSGGTSNWIIGSCARRSISTNALNFDGIDDYVDMNMVAAPMANATSFTIEFWMKADLNNQSSSSYPSTSMFAINLPISTPTGSNRLLFMLGDPYSSQNGKLWIGNNIGTPFQSSVVIGDNSCHHIAYSHNSNIGSIYIDGVLVGSFNDNITLSSTDLYSLGQEWDGNSTSQYYNGELDEVRIWNIARLQGDIITSMYTSLSGSEAGLIAYYNFNQGISGGNNSGIITLNDNTNSGYNGTLNNFALNGSFSNWVTDSCSTITVINQSMLTNNKVAIYPNPASNQLKIVSVQKIKEVRIIDVTGKLVKTIIDDCNTVDISDFSRGLYFIILIFDNNIVMKKIIKQ